jgi:hypothetical protein
MSGSSLTSPRDVFWGRWAPGNIAGEQEFGCLLKIHVQRFRLPLLIIGWPFCSGPHLLAVAFNTLALGHGASSVHAVPAFPEGQIETECEPVLRRRRAVGMLRYLVSVGVRDSRAQDCDR